MTSTPPPVDDVLTRPDTEESTGWPRRRKLIAGLVLTFGIGVLVALWTYDGEGTRTRYVTQPVTRGDLSVSVSATGTLEPTNKVEVGSELSGRIASVSVDYNDTVRVGQELARIDTSRVEAQVKQSRAALAAAQARVLVSEATRTETRAQLDRLIRMRGLTEEGIPSDSDLDAARAALARADAEVASSRALVLQSRATLDAQLTDLGKAVIRSPIDGVVLQRSIEAGQTVAASLQAPVLFVLAESLKQMELHVDVDEADVSDVAAGQQATFTVDAFPDRQFVANVTKVHYGARTVSGVVTYETVLVVDNAALELRPGMTATANILVQRRDAVMKVPNAALRFTPPGEEQPAEPAPSGGLVGKLLPRFAPRGPARAADSRGLHRVWVLSGNRPVAVEVATGVSDGVETEIVKGDLREGAAVIVDASGPSA